MTKEDKLLDAIGGISDKHVRIAVGDNSKELGLRTDTHSIDFPDVERATPEEIRRYRIRTAIIGGAAAALALAGGIFLWSRLKDIPISPEPADSSSAAVTTVSSGDLTGEITAQTDPLPVVTNDNYLSVESNKAYDRYYMRLVCDDKDYVWTNEDGKTVFQPEYARIEFIDSDDYRTPSARLVTYEDMEITLDRDIVIKFAANGLGEYAGLVFVPTSDGRYCMSVYYVTNPDQIDCDTYNIRMVDSPADVRFDNTKTAQRAFEIIFNGDEAERLVLYPELIPYDDKTPYYYLDRGRTMKERMQPNEYLRLYAPITGDVLPYSESDQGNYQIMPDASYARMTIDGFEYDEKTKMYLGINGGDISVSLGIINSDECNLAGIELTGVKRFDENGSFNIITHTLKSGRVLVLAGIPVYRRFNVYAFIYDGAGLYQLEDFMLDTASPLESIECDGVDTLSYNDTYSGGKQIVIDFDTMTYCDKLNPENEEAVEKLAELTSSDGIFAYPLDRDGGMDTFVYDGEKFTATPDGFYGTFYSVTGGTVEDVNYAAGYGNYIQVRDYSGQLWTYTNLYNYRYVKRGDTVHPGDALGDVLNELTIWYGKEIVPEPLTNPMLIDESKVKIECGEPIPSGSLSEFSADNSITHRYIGWADEWTATHDDEYKRDKAGEFLDSLGVDGLKELYYKGKFLAGVLITDDFSDIDGYKGVTITHMDAYTVEADGCVISLPGRQTAMTNYDDRFLSSGFSYESFYDTWLGVFTEEWALTLLNKFPAFVKYGDELYYMSTAAGGDMSHLYTEYELITQTDDEIEFVSIGYHALDRDNLVYDPALKNVYPKTYTPYRFVRTDNGWRIALSDTEYIWR